MRRISQSIRYFLIVLLFSLTLPLFQAHADVAPPEQAPGSNIEPAQPTKVQMAAESVLIDVLSVKGKGKSDLPLAAVTARFTMRNASDADETMVVRFPISDPNGYGDGFGGQPEIDNIVVKVNGKTVPTRVINTPNPQGGNAPPINWAAFDVTFPKGEDTLIDVSYIQQSTGYMPYGAFKYIIETGAGWDGPIGNADFTLKLPYPATEENVVLNGSTPGGRIENGQVKWTFTNLEPTRDDNLIVNVLAPSVWQAIVQARDAVQKNPNDADAWRALARAYRAAIFVKYGPQTGANFVPQIEDAYRQAQRADPTSAQAHSELAQALIDLNEPIFDELPKELADKVFAELQAALKLDPRNATAVKLAGEMRTLLESLVKAGNPNAQAQLDQLEAIITDTGAQVRQPASAPTDVPTAPVIEATGTVTPTEAITPTESVTSTTPTDAITSTATVSPAEPMPVPVVTTETVSATTGSGAVITTTVMTSTSRVIIDAITSLPVTVTEMSSVDVVTSTSDVTGTQPVIVVVVRTSGVATQTVPSPDGTPAAIVTATTSTRESSPVVDGQVGTPSGVVTSSAVITALTQVLIDAVTSQPITVTSVTQSETSTEATAGLTETAPTQTQINETVVTTQTVPDPATGAVVVVTGTTRSIEIAPSVSITINVPARVITQTEEMTATTEANPVTPTLPATITVVVVGDTVTQDAGEAGRAPSVVTSTRSSRRTEEANPMQPTLPATVTEVIASQDVTATTAITSEAGAEAGAPVIVTATQVTTSTEEMNPIDAQMPATKTETSITQVVTATSSVSQPGASTVVTTTTTTTGTMPIPADVTNPPPMTQVEQTEIVTTTVDAAGQMTTTPPIISVITKTLPVLPLPTRAPRVQPTPVPEATPAAGIEATPADTTSATAEASTADATPEATPEGGAVAVAETPAATAEAGAASPASSGRSGLFGIPTEAFLPLGITYLIGFIVVFWLLSRSFKRNKV